MGSSRHEQAPGHLPLEINTMVGRRQETVDVRALLAAHRLVTLTGPGGIGKTRTALHVAHAARRTFADGAWFVELGAVRDPALVAQVVLETLKVTDSSTRDPQEVLCQHLRSRHVLLVLDNCEQVLDAVAVLVAGLLQQVPDTLVLSTSRQPLGVPGEATYRLDPLPVPADAYDGAHGEANGETNESADGEANGGTNGDVRDLSGYAAIELFATRARAALGEFEVDASNRRDVVRLCSRLEGLPLALELAASRLRVMTVADLLRRLDDRFGMLKGTSPVVAPRHRTLLAAVAWSHDLCTPDEQLLWRRASVFSGSFDLAAAEAVCCGGELARDGVLDALLGLVDKSVVVNEQLGDRMRFRMLDTIREYGEERLAEAGETERVLVRLCSWASALLTEAAAGWFGARQLEWAATLRAEHPNLRAALDFCATHPEHAREGQQMAGAAWFYWVACEYLSEGRLWLERLLAAEPAPSQARALALGTTAYIASLQGDTDRGAVTAAECQQLAEELGDATLTAYGVHMRALSASLGNQREVAEELFQRARALYDGVEAAEGWRLLLLVQHGAKLAQEGHPDTAAGWFRELEQTCEPRGEKWVLGYAYWGLALVAYQRGDYDAAERLLRRTIEMKRDFHDSLGLALALDTIAWVLAEQGDAARAACIIGAASGLWATFGTDLFGSDFLTAGRTRCEATARVQLGDTTYDDAVRLGAATGLNDTLWGLVEAEPERTAPARRTDSVLTRREQEVARLVAEGLTNRQIAERLVIALRTAEGHVENVLRKLDFHSRAQIATWFATQDDA